jgi:hypothetical protein
VDERENGAEGVTLQKKFRTREQIYLRVSLPRLRPRDESSSDQRIAEGESGGYRDTDSRLYIHR